MTSDRSEAGCLPVPLDPPVGRHGVATKKSRAEQASRFLAEIAACGRKFFAHNGRVSRFDVDDRGRVWFIDAYREARIYTHYEYRWRGFSEGGTLRDLVIQLRDFIRTGQPAKLYLGPCPDWVCKGGDLWGYGDDMATVREAAVACGVVTPNVLTDRPAAPLAAGPATEGSEVERRVGGRRLAGADF